MLRYLRQHGNYLTPGEGITLTSVDRRPAPGHHPEPARLDSDRRGRDVVPDLAVGTARAGYRAAVVPAPVTESRRAWAPTWLAEFVGDISPPLKSEVKAPASVAEPAGTISPPQPESPKLYSFGVMLATAIFLFLAACLRSPAILSPPGSVTSRAVLSSAARNTAGAGCFERWMRVPFWTIGVLLLLASVPFVAGEFHGWLLGSSFSLIGLASGLARLREDHAAAQEQGRAADQLGDSEQLDRLVRRGLSALRRLTGVLCSSAGGQRKALPSWAFRRSRCLPRAFILAIVTGFAVDLNLITIHRFYRDRLMEAFLPDVDQALRNRTAPARQADSATLSSMCDHRHPVGPYHIINANLVLNQIQRKDLSAARRRQLHPVAALLRQQRDRLAIDQTLHGRRADRADRDGDLGRAPPTHGPANGGSA